MTLAVLDLAYETSGLMRRYPSWTEAKAEEILRLISIGVPIKSAAASAGVPKSTLDRWRKRIPVFEESIQMARDAAVTGKVAIVSAAAKGRGAETHKCPEKGCPGLIKVPALKGVWTAAAWWLERTHHEQFGRKDILESKIDIRVKVEISRFATMVVMAVNEEVTSVADRQRLRDRLLERFGLEDTEGDTGRGQALLQASVQDVSPGPPQGPA